MAIRPPSLAIPATARHATAREVGAGGHDVVDKILYEQHMIGSKTGLVGLMSPSAVKYMKGRTPAANPHHL